MTTRPILVGVDGSKPALAAVRWAAEEARKRNAPLLLAHVLSPIAPLGGIGTAVPTTPVSMVESDVQDVLADAVEVATRVLGAGDVREQIVYGPAAVSLIELSESAELVVVGTRGAGPLSRILLGSVSGHVAAHAHCPVVVIPSETPLGGPVVVGIDGSQGSAQAFRFALDFASRHGVELHAVYGLHLDAFAESAALASTVSDLVAESERYLAQVVAGASETHPDVVITTKILRRSPVEMLLEETGDASLVVVGSRGRGAFKGMVLGSVSQAVLRHATRPVAVVHTRPETDAS